MNEAWTKLEGQTVDEKFYLRQFLGGSQHSGVFLTERGEGGAQKAAIKLTTVAPTSTKLQLSRWEAASKLSHPNLVRLFETGRWRVGNTDMLYVVMDYADEDLSQILPQRPLTPAETREMLRPTLDALAYLHAKGFVHGHIKPANIMAQDDRLKLSSDGLCRMGEPWSGLRQPGPYDSPESASGRASTAADVWSLGVTLVEVLTKKLPVWEPSRHSDPQVPQNLPAPFQEIARECLRRDPQRRWSVAEIAARLAPTAAPATATRVPVATPAQTSPAAVRPQRPPATSRYIIPAMAAAFVLIAIVAVPRILKRPPEPPPTPSSRPAVAGAKPQARQKPSTPVADVYTAKSREKEQSSDADISPASSPSPSPRPVVPARMRTGEHIRGEVLEQALPEASQKAHDTIQGTVRVGVKIFVDDSGNVTGTALDSPGPSKYFAGLALNAARRWEFAPAKVGGQPVPSEWLVRFEFTNDNTRAFPRQTAP